MKVLTRNNLLQFIADLSGPKGPEIFSGFGSKLQKEISGDLRAPDRIKGEWALEVDPIQAMDVLFEISCNPPGKDFCNNFYGRFKENWEYEITDLLNLVGKRDRRGLIERMRIFQHNENAMNIVKELSDWLSEEAE